MEDLNNSQVIHDHTINNSKSQNYKWPRYYNQYYVNKEDNIFVESLFESGLSKYDYIKKISDRVPHYHKKYTSLVVCTIHKAASHNRIDILEHYLKDDNDRIKFLNCPFGRQGYTSVFRAAYNGNITTLKFLVCIGGDITIKNTENESVLDAIEEGRVQNVIKNQDDAIFIEDRYNECKKFISTYEVREDKEIIFKK